jgi:GNAT superfamily N-acetyltransferase
MTTTEAMTGAVRDDANGAALRRAIARTLAYADIFDHPLRLDEIHRYLIGHRASHAAVESALARDDSLRTVVEHSCEWYHLRGRSRIVDIRRRRSEASARLWPAARRYARVIAGLPLVRFVGLTGALSMDCAEEGSDIDLFVLTTPRRLWTARLLILAVVRVAAMRGVTLCPNFLLSTDRALLTERNVFTAHELAQMVPIAAMPGGDRLGAANEWTREFLPNAGVAALEAGSAPLLSRVLSAMLAWRIFDPLERWEMRRKIRRLESRARREGGSVAFSAGECRGHFAAHDIRVRAAYAARCAELDLVLG